MLVRELVVDQITLPPPDNERLHGNLDRLVASAKQLKDATTPGGKGTARSPARPQVSPSTRGTAPAIKADAAADAALQRAAQAERKNAELKSALEAARGDVEEQARQREAAARALEDANSRAQEAAAEREEERESAAAARKAAEAAAAEAELQRQRAQAASKARSVVPVLAPLAVALLLMALVFTVLVVGSPGCFCWDPTVVHTAAPVVDGAFVAT